MSVYNLIIIRMKENRSNARSNNECGLDKRTVLDCAKWRCVVSAYPICEIKFKKGTF